MTKLRAVKIWLHIITQGKVTAIRIIRDVENLGMHQIGKMQTVRQCKFYTFFRLHLDTLTVSSSSVQTLKKYTHVL
jgi:hypothetical protein